MASNSTNVSILQPPQLRADSGRGQENQAVQYLCAYTAESKLHTQYKYNTKVAWS
jgi:hypothetical protein